MQTGLSPPTRGSPWSTSSRPSGRGSIPAHAGEPGIVVSVTSYVGVYPRPRGGARPKKNRRTARSGLSPPTRGSHVRARPDLRSHGSIPAHAGEPDPSGEGEPLLPVYPRPRGGAQVSSATTIATVGLSPPTRGSLCRHAMSIATSRSIPAHAGEPLKGDGGAPGETVYPRPRGGALFGFCAWYDIAGLSPPTRGSPWWVIPVFLFFRSIPAHAGEPDMGNGARRHHAVYPRPRGGAGSSGSGASLC